MLKSLSAAIDRDGVAVLANAVPHAICDIIMAELRQYTYTTDSMGSIGSVGCVLSRSATARHHMAAHPAVLGVVEGVLGRQLFHTTDGSTKMRWRVHVHETIPKTNGPPQDLHRDGDLHLIELDNEIEHAIGIIWALDGDFTDLRGTTRAVVGSRHWPRAHPQEWGGGNHRRTPSHEDSVGAVMPRGSCFFYSGRTYHGSGQNDTESPREALNIAYALSFLKQEMNTFVGVPPVVTTPCQHYWSAKRLHSLYLTLRLVVLDSYATSLCALAR
jgi:ectoine hydroxylase-related dioxygenase (phytanoyl-CoA dioxygenase family)